MKNLMKCILMLAFAVLATTVSFGQNVPPASRNNVSFDIPNRLKKIKKEGQKYSFRDSKTSTKLSFEKINTSELENLALSQAKIDYMACAAKSQNVDVQVSTREYLLGLGQTLDWNILSKSGNKISEGSRSVLMDINGTLYRFVIEFDVEERKAAYNLLNNFLDKSVPLFNVSSFRN